MDAKYWDKRYQDHNSPWDIGHISPPLKSYFDLLDPKDSVKILIPGAGRAYEGEYLFEAGHQFVYVLDWSESVMNDFRTRVPGFPKEQTLVADFFGVEPSYDLIVEQTFFCAIDPSLRPKYVQKVHELLQPGGSLVGLLFNAPFEDHPGPPFGGSAEEYRTLFQEHFEIERLEECTNSLKPRQGKELFFVFTKK